MPPSTLHAEPLGFRVWPVHEMAAMPQAHTHSDIEVNFLYEGEQTLRYLHGGTIYDVEPGRLALLWGGIPHQTLAPGVVGEGIWLTLPLAWFLQWELPYNLAGRLLAGEIIQGTRQDGDRALLERWVADHQSGTRERQRVLLLEVEARLHRLALEQHKRPASRPIHSHASEGTSHIERITRFIAEHYQEELSIEDIAGAVRLDPKYLMRLFKKLCHLSVWEYLTRLRISHAQRLLITTDWKVVDIALASGFASVAPFYAAFRMHSQGLRPLAYRRKHAMGESAGRLGR